MLGRLANRSALASARRSVPPWVWILVRAAISAGLIAWLTAHFDWTSTWGLLSKVDWRIILGGIGLTMLSHLLAARRLQIILAAQNISISFLLSAQLVLAGLFAGNFLPSTVGGDVVKIAWLARDQRSGTLAIASVFADRLINLVALLLMLPSTVAIRHILPPRVLTLVTYGISGLALVCLIGGIVLLLLRHPLCRWLESPAAGSGAYAAFHSQLRRVASIAVTWTQRPGTFLRALVLSWGSVLSAIAGLYLIGYHLGITVSFPQVIGVTVIVYFLTLVPISLNGLGLQEASLAYLLGSLGATSSQALAIAVSARLLSVTTSLPGATGVSARRDSYMSHQGSVPGEQ